MAGNKNAADELEFLNVDNLNDNQNEMNQGNNLNRYSGGGIGGGGNNDTEIGAWFFKQSKVCVCIYIYFILVYILCYEFLSLCFHIYIISTA